VTGFRVRAKPGRSPLVSALSAFASHRNLAKEAAFRDRLKALLFLLVLVSYRPAAAPTPARRCHRRRTPRRRRISPWPGSHSESAPICIAICAIVCLERVSPSSFSPLPLLPSPYFASTRGAWSPSALRYISLGTRDVRRRSQALSARVICLTDLSILSFCRSPHGLSLKILVESASVRWESLDCGSPILGGGQRAGTSFPFPLLLTPSSSPFSTALVSHG
jgi:hypothetical protein